MLHPVVEALGYPRLERDELMSVPRSEIDALAESTRSRLPVATRRVFERG